ncbi:MAG: 2-C-methyl-D-erythritol 2,4-cyclodiphosphate synthase [Clostridia bacterium]|nr:2-C-methyl-D-erythritol 2,4-cyclodiphosphate synthase [Clostridia bacterium]
MSISPAPFVTAIIVAAGNSTRMGTGYSKQFIMLGSKPVIAHTLIAFEKCLLINEIIVVAREQDKEQILAAARDNNIKKLSAVVKGGDTRQQSVAGGIAAADENCRYFAIHDGTRPLVTREVIERAVACAVETGAASAAVKVKDTVKQADENQKITATVDRSMLWAVQTPQVFEKELYLKAMRKAAEDGLDFTDDCQLIEHIGVPVMLSQGDESNIKLTTPQDISLAKSLICNGGSTLRIGHGYDVHKLVEGRRLIMGGVDIPHERGLLGHSDADVLCHAISDALLGAAAMGDIGGMFPDTDPAFKNADSIKLLTEVAGALRGRGYEIANIDATIIAQAPKMKPHIDKMRENIARACGIETACVSVKATTEEGLGFTGTKEGISAHAVCLIN